MSLKGSLQTIALPEVLQLLSTTGKSGGLHVAGDEGEGRLWFVDGRVTAFSADPAQEPVEALFELLRLPQGDFSFVADEEPDSDAVKVEGGADVVPTLEAAQQRLSEWHEITEVVPSLDHHLELSAEAPSDSVSMDRAQWALVVAVGDGRAVRDVLERVGLAEFDGCRSVRSLVEGGLVQVKEAVVASVTPLTTLSIVADEPAVEDSWDSSGRAEQSERVEAADHEPLAEAFTDVDALPGSILRFGVDSSSEPVPAHGEHEVAELEPARPTFPDFFASVPTEVGSLDPVEESDSDEAVQPQEAHWGPFGADAPVDSQWSRPEADPEAGVEAQWDHAQSVVHHEAPVESTSAADDRYAALKAAMLEVHDSEGDGGADAHDSLEPAGYTDPVAHQYEIGAGPDSRAALEALLSEVRGEEEANAAGPWTDETPAVAYEPIDGLADRGPWTENELASMEPQAWSAAVEEPAADPVAFGRPLEGAASPAVSEYGDETAPEVEVAEEAQAAASEEPMNRGLLLKFLSSVRN